MKQSFKKESQEMLKAKSRLVLPDFSSLNVQDLTPITNEIIINQPTINIIYKYIYKKGLESQL